MDNIPSLTPATDYIEDPSHNVEFLWNYWPLYYILWPIGIPINVILFPFFFLQLPFQLIWNFIPHLIEIPTIAIIVIVASVIGIVVGTLTLAIWLVSIIPITAGFTGIYLFTWPLIGLLSSPFILLAGAPLSLVWGAYKFAVMMLVIAVLATED